MTKKRDPQIGETQAARTERMLKQVLAQPVAPDEVIDLSQQRFKERIKDFKRRAPVPRSSYSLLLVYRNCRYFTQAGLAEPVMDMLAKAIWADEESSSPLDEEDRARILAAFDDIWDAQEGGGDDEEIAHACAELHRVIISVVPQDLYASEALTAAAARRDQLEKEPTPFRLKEKRDDGFEGDPR